MMKLNRFSFCVVLAASILGTVFGQGPAGDRPGGQREQKLIGVLKSGTAAEQAMACKELAIYGTKDAVASLAPLLADERLASWARIALEAIPDPACDAALRDAAGRLRGRLLIGVINSLGVRRDVDAAGILAGKLRDADAEVAAAAAAALGRIGTQQAATVLGQALALSSGRDRAAVAHGCILCAQRFQDEGKSAEAMSLYDAVREADVPAQTVLEATRGAILSRGEDGVGLLIEQLRSEDRGRLGIGLRTARELGGKAVTEALAAELSRLAADRQGLLLLAIADRNDSAVLPAVLKAARPAANANALRLTAVKTLERLGGVSAVEVLLEAAIEEDEALSAAAKASLSRLPDEAEAAMLNRLATAKGKTRQVLLELCAARQIAAALPAAVQSTKDTDAGVRAAAVDAVGALGGVQEAPVLVSLLKDAEERSGIEKALRGVASRAGAACGASLLPLTKESDPALRVIGLRVLAVAGGDAALQAIVSGTADASEAVQDEAVRMLSTWPNTRPDDAGVAEPLLKLAKSGSKESHRVLGVRGYLQYVRSTTNLTSSEKVSRVAELLPLVARAEEKRLVIAVLGQAGTAKSIDMLTKLAEEPALKEEAWLAVATLCADTIEGLSVEQRRALVQKVIETSANEATKKKAREVLGKLR